MKAFDTPHHQDYYKDWIYLGTVSNQDYYLQALPCKAKRFPCTSVVYGANPEQYISTTMSVDEMLNTELCLKRMEFYLEHSDLSHMIHLIAFIREYAGEGSFTTTVRK